MSTESMWDIFCPSLGTKVDDPDNLSKPTSVLLHTSISNILECIFKFNNSMVHNVKVSSKPKFKKNIT